MLHKENPECPFCKGRLRNHTTKRCLDAWFAKNVLKYTDVGRHRMLSTFIEADVGKVWCYKDRTIDKLGNGESAYTEIKPYSSNLNIMLDTWKRLKLSDEYQMRWVDLNVEFERSSYTGHLTTSYGKFWSISHWSSNVIALEKRLETVLVKAAIIHIATKRGGNENRNRL